MAFLRRLLAVDEEDELMEKKDSQKGEAVFSPNEREEIDGPVQVHGSEL